VTLSSPSDEPDNPSRGPDEDNEGLQSRPDELLATAPVYEDDLARRVQHSMARIAKPRRSPWPWIVLGLVLMAAAGLVLIVSVVSLSDSYRPPSKSGAFDEKGMPKDMVEQQMMAVPPVMFDPPPQPVDTPALAVLQRFPGGGSPGNSVVLSHDGLQVFTADRNVIIQWEKGTGNEVRRYVGHTADAGPVAVTPDGKRLFSSGRDNTVRLWDLKTGQEIRQFRQPGVLWAAAVSPDGKHVATAGEDRVIRLYGVEGGEQEGQLEGQPALVVSLAFSPDGRRLVSGAQDRSFWLWDVKTGKEVRRYQSPLPMRAVRFSPDGQRLLLGGENALLALWDLDKDQEVRRFIGHQDIVCGLAFTSDGRHLVSGGHDGTVRLWDAVSARELAHFRDDAGACNRVEVGHDGRYILVNGCQDGVPKLLQLPPAVWPRAGEIRRR
jgi:WD40 repeat protein